MVPQNNFAPYVPIGQTMIPSEIPTMVQPQVVIAPDILSSAQQTQMSPSIPIQKTD